MSDKYRREEEEIEKLKEELAEIKNTINCQVISNDGIKETYDEKAYNEKNLLIAKKELQLSLKKYSDYKIFKRNLTKAWKNYHGLLNEKLQWLKGQRTIRTTNNDYVEDVTAINELVDFINEEFNSYQSSVTNRPTLLQILWKLMYENSLVSIIIALVGFPVIVGIVVSTPSPFSLTVTNDWIGFWANYSGGIIGAIIGGIIALKIANESFKKQVQLGREEKITELRMKSLPSFIITIIDIKQKLELDNQYIKSLYYEVKSTYEQEKDKDEISFESIKTQLQDGVKLIRENKIKIYDLLEEYLKQHELNRYFVNRFDQKLQLGHNATLNIIKASAGFEELYNDCLNGLINSNMRINIQSFDKSISKLQDAYTDIQYLLYEIIVALRNEISSDLFLMKSYKMPKEDYVKAYYK